LVLVVLAPLVVLLVVEPAAIIPCYQLSHLRVVDLAVLEQLMVLPVVQAVVVLALVGAVHLKVLVIPQALAHPKVITAEMAAVLRTTAEAVVAQVQLVRLVVLAQETAALALLTQLQAQQQVNYLVALTI
jgi:hypothetical protein